MNWQTLKDNPHTSVVAVVVGVCLVGSIWLPQYEDKFHKTKEAAEAWGFLMAGDALRRYRNGTPGATAPGQQPAPSSVPAAVIIILLAILALAGCATQTAIHGIANFAKVESGVYRGGQPNAEGWNYLATLGVTNVVKLNAWRENLYEPAISDERASKLGMTVLGDEIDFPTQAFPHCQVFLPPEVELAIATIKPGTFIHCLHGQDRTGLVVACYRVRMERWSKGQAEAEMLAHGFHKELYGLWSYWAEFK